jgi:hypothetical protein
MKLLKLPSILVLAAASLFIVPVESQARDRKITVHRDNDGDGHYNKKTITVRDRNDRYRGSYGSGYYGNPYHGSRYYGNRYYGRSYGYPYGYGYGYRPGVSVTYSSSPRYYSSYSSNAAVDVQRELRRRGYYRGAIDGDVGPGTRAAIRAYQYNRGLAVTGRIDNSLLRSLGV